MRKQSWAEDLATYMKESSTKEFQWGVHDCASFAAGAVTAVTGRFIDVKDFADAHTVREVVELLATKSLKDRVTEILGKTIDLKMATRGDIVLLTDLGRECLGVCFGEVSFFLTAKGLQPIKTLTCDCAWRIE